MAGLLSLALVAVLPAQALATQFCINTQSEFVAALETAKANGQNDALRVVAGTYTLTTNLVMITHEANAIAISGGWNASCSLQNGGNTTLDGDATHWILFLYSYAASPMTITDLAFVGGKISGGSNSGAGLSVQSQGSIQIERNEFIANESSYSTGGLYAGSGGTLTVRNNLLLANTAPYFGAAQLVGNGAEAIVTGNTIVGNTATNASASGGIHIGGSGHFTLSNNLIYFNTHIDLDNGATGTVLACNDIGPVSGLAVSTGGTFGNMDVDPEFVPGLFSVRLASSSPLVNAGTNTPAGGLGIYDAGGDPRLQAGHVDIGAYETDVLFYSGVEPLPELWP
jgi:parallel beta-helix repeat protein